jgi:putative SOS response-associated peptidase YedK
MCGRYVLTQTHARSLLAQLGVRLEAENRGLPPSRYNLPPGSPILAVRSPAKPPKPRAENWPPTADNSRTPPAPESPGTARELAWLHWGLTPAWAGTDTRPLTNARAESLVDKPTFRRAYQSRRCLIPASGFYEWQVTGRTRRPWLFQGRKHQPFAFAALWETYHTPDGQILEACALITTAANALMQPIHHRMPAILLEAAAWEAWLDPRITSTQALAPLLRPLPAEALSATPVSARVNQVRHDDPACLEPVTPGEAGDAAADDTAQLSLGL